MDVSVIIPTFNRPQLLKDTLESVLRQTLPAREIIVVDNGTNDDTRALVEASFGSTVTYIRQSRRGVQAARNAGIERAGGTWIATLDDDDLRHPDFLEQLRPAAADGRANLIYSDHHKFVEDGDRTTPYRQTNFEMAPPGYWDGVPKPANGQNWSFAGKFPPERILRFNAFYPSTMMARRDLIQDIGGFDPAVAGIKAEDIEFLMRALIHGQLAIVWLPLVEYRIHGSNACGGDWVSQMIGRWQVFERIYAHGAYGSASLKAALERDLPGRRAKTFDQAWRHSRFADVDDLRPLLRDEDWTLLRRIRLAVRAAPAPVRSSVMQVRKLLAPLASAASGPALAAPLRSPLA